MQRRAEIEIWRVDYHCERPHSALDCRTPKAFGDPITKALVRNEVPPAAPSKLLAIVTAPMPCSCFGS